jgi:predicted transposase/invertase (TIGR01784 family)
MLKGVQQGIRQGIQQGVQQGIQQGVQQGKQEGIQQGKQDEKWELARKLKADGIFTEQIAKWTGLSEAQIREL